ncbi:uncharacterized protein [Antedon mediterranea]|uniref:uncharacterized protein n=1 Tax=Antedon mediterranea TaxID=105859 RepID=UPI003AF4B881
MACAVLDELKEQALTCELCFEVPGGAQGDTNVFKQLSCSHAFCKLCIQRLAEQVRVEEVLPLSEILHRYRYHDQDNYGWRRNIACPNCRAITSIEGEDVDNGVDKLPSVFKVTNVIDWVNRKQEKEKEMKDRVCSVHEGVPYNFFCLDCSKFVCGDGLRLTDSHEEHTTLYVKTEAEPIRKAAQDMMEEIGCQLGHWKKAHEEVEAMISIIDDDTSKAMELLEKYTKEIRKSLILAQDLLRKTIMNTQKKKIEVLEKEKDAILRKIQEIEKKISEQQKSIKKADKFEVFNEHVAITKMRQQFLADKCPDLAPMMAQQAEESLKFEPNFISLKRLKNDIARFGKVHKQSEESFSITTSYSEGLSPEMLKSMEDVVKEAYELDLSKVEQVEDRRTKLTFIVKHLEDVLGEEWNCILGDFEKSIRPGEFNQTVTFLVNEVDNVTMCSSFSFINEEEEYECEEEEEEEEYECEEEQHEEQRYTRNVKLGEYLQEMAREVEQVEQLQDKYCVNDEDNYAREVQHAEHLKDMKEEVNGRRDKKSYRRLYRKQKMNKRLARRDMDQL